MPVLLYSRYLFVVISLSLVLFPSYAMAQQDAAPLVIDADGGSVPIPDVGELNTFDADIDAKILLEEEGDDGEVSSSDANVDISEGSFFDANDIVPQGEMAREGPILLDPSTQPASKYVIVRKTHEADHKDARLVSAERAMALGRFDSALLMFDALYEVNKKDPRILMGRAVALQKLTRFDDAMKTYEELSEIEPDNIDIKVNMLGLLGTRYPAIALRRLLNLYDANKNNIGLTAQIAVAYAKSGDARTALSYLGMAASMDPDNANHIFNMAVISDRSGDTKKAASYYEQALEIDTIHGAGRSIPRDVVYERLAQIR